ncbi:MAG: flavin-containing monooxygenase [Actinomycetota bacterium]
MPAERFDVVVVGAGISGIGAGVHLNDKSPDRSFVILEGREDIGGTWDLFKYPGIRSDSDMHTLGYEFKPWKAEKSIADGPSIMAYLRETVEEHDLNRHMRFGERVVRAEWSTQNATWSVYTQRSDGSHGTFECNYLFMCAGYYSYKAGYLPEFPGREKFGGTIVHPQEWPEDLDYSNKRVVVIGSGATAVTIVPAVAETAAHVTMLQRSPTYMVSRPDTDALANFLRRILPAQLAYNITRAKNTWRQQLVYKQTRSNPDQITMLLLGGVQLELGGKYPIKRHFLPRYNPWDQRLCLVPNSDFFAAMRSGRASVVTDNIETFTETGILLSSGEHLNADIIVTATGLQLVSRMWLSRRHTYVQVRSARSVHDALMYPKLVARFGTSLYAMPLYVRVWAKSTCWPSTEMSASPSDTNCNPVAVTMMSALRCSPDDSKIPVSVKVSMLSVTTDARPLRIAAKKSEFGTRHKR